MLTETLLRISPGCRYYLTGLKAASCMHFFWVKTALRGLRRELPVLKAFLKLETNFKGKAKNLDFSTTR
jgi:hypothetical protein